MTRRDRITVNGEVHEISLHELSRERVVFELGGRNYRVEFERTVPLSQEAEKRTTSKQTRSESIQNGVSAPMPGVVVGLHCQVGEVVSQGDVLIRIEAMKMQNSVVAPMDGRVEEIFVSIGDEVRDGQALLQLLPSEDLLPL